VTHIEDLEKVGTDDPAIGAKHRERRVPDAVRAARWIAALALFVATIVYYYLISRRIWGGNSDVATPLLQGEAIAHGHPTLDGWAFLHDSFWTIDVLFYTIGYFVRGLDPHLMFVIPAIVGAVILVLGMYLACAGQQRRARWVAAVAVVVLIGLPTQGWTFLFLSVYGHPATILYCLIAFAALRTPGSGWRWSLAVLVLAMGLVGDLQTLPLGVGPVFGAGVLAMLRSRSVRAGASLVGAAVAAPVVGYLFWKLAVLVGTYTIGGTNPYASSAQMRSNLSNIPATLDTTFGSGLELSGSLRVKQGHDDWFGRLLQDGEIRTVATVVVSVLVVVAVLRIVKQTILGEDAPGERPDRRVEDMLATACVADLVFYIAAALLDGPVYSRYLASFVIFGSVLAARYIGRFSASDTAVPVRRLAGAIGGVVAVGIAVASMSALTVKPTPFANSETIDFLLSKGLHRGVAPFWDASQTTVASRGEVIVRPITATPDRIYPRDQLARDTWYNEPFEFLLCPPVTPFEGVSCEIAVRQFGEPAERYTVGANDVLVWDKPIDVRP